MAAATGRDVSGDGGVLIATTRAGTGIKPEEGMIVFVQYVGKLTDGTVFDSTREKPHRRDIGFYFQLGAGQVIKGWDVGFLNMTVGESATLTLRYDYGYGEQGMRQSGIPPKATLVFDVELKDAKFMDAAALDAVDAEVERLRG